MCCYFYFLFLFFGLLSSQFNADVKYNTNTEKCLHMLLRRWLPCIVDISAFVAMWVQDRNNDDDDCDIAVAVNDSDEVNNSNV